jgi:hypothetical protein
MKLSHALLASLLVASSLAPPAVAAPAVGDSKSSKSSKSKNASEPGPRVVEAADRRAFYRGGWRTLLHRRVHLHVETEVLRHAPQRSGEHGRWLRFDNRSVALVISATSPEWRKAQQDLGDCSEFCLHGTVRLAPAGSRAPAQLEVDSIERAPGSKRR